MNRKRILVYLLILIGLPILLYLLRTEINNGSPKEISRENINIIGDDGKRSEIYYDHYFGSGPLMLIRLDEKSRISIKKENGEGKVIAINSIGERLEIEEELSGFSEDHYELQFEGKNFSGRILVER